MSDIKTKVNDKNVLDFLNSVEGEQKKQDSLEILEMMKEITGAEPKMWGDSIIGFGEYHYRYASGREGDWFQAGFSPRKQSISLYLMYGIGEKNELTKNLGKFKTGKACLYIKKLDDVDRNILKDLIRESVNKVCR